MTLPPSASSSSTPTWVSAPATHGRSIGGWSAPSWTRWAFPNVGSSGCPDAPDPEGACRAYDRALQAAGGFDLAVLGLGPNGHLGFNEPPCGREAPTRVVSLTPQSVESNARYWGGPEQVPRRALTAGMAVLLTARRILLLAAGESKADILRRTLEGPINPDVPASYLQTVPGVTVIADRAAAGLLHASAR